MKADATDVMKTHVFLDLKPPEGGLAAVQARLRRQQMWRRGRVGLALAALALIMVRPALMPTPTPTAVDWSDDIAMVQVDPSGPQVMGRAGLGVLEVGRTQDILMVRVIAIDRPTAPARP